MLLAEVRYSVITVTCTVTVVRRDPSRDAGESTRTLLQLWPIAWWARGRPTLSACGCDGAPEGGVVLRRGAHDMLSPFSRGLV